MLNIQKNKKSKKTHYQIICGLPITIYIIIVKSQVFSKTFRPVLCFLLKHTLSIYPPDIKTGTYLYNVHPWSFCIHQGKHIRNPRLYFDIRVDNHGYL